VDNHNDFLKAERERVAKLYGKKHKKGFQTKDSFVEWYSNQIQCQNFRCFYCDTSIFDIRSLIDGKKLRTRKTKHGCRGPVLEIDRKENDKGYSPDNCVLSCYYCNNDKSYITDGDDYKIHFGGNRKKYFRMLMKQ
jgi:hypothetical protein